MSVHYNGKSPGRLWYAWQKTAAFGKSFFDYTTRKDSWGIAKNLGIGLGVLAVGLYVAAPLVASIPLAAPVVSIVSCVVACNFGYKSWFKFRDVRDSRFMEVSIRDKEEQWLENKQKPGLFARIGAKMKRAEKPKFDKNPIVKKPIEQGQVFSPEGASFDFNDGAAAPANDTGKPAGPKKSVKGPKP